MAKYCVGCGAYTLPEQLADGKCLACYIEEHGRIVVDPHDFATRFVQMSFELAQLRERRKAAVKKCEEYRRENQELRAKLRLVIEGMEENEREG